MLTQKQIDKLLMEIRLAVRQELAMASSSDVENAEVEIDEDPEDDDDAVLDDKALLAELRQDQKDAKAKSVSNGHHRIFAERTSEQIDNGKGSFYKYKRPSGDVWNIPTSTITKRLKDGAIIAANIAAEKIKGEIAWIVAGRNTQDSYKLTKSKAKKRTRTRS